MPRALIAFGVLVSLAALVTDVAAQQAAPGDPRQRLQRNQQQRPQTQQRLDESLRKFNDDDISTRLEGIQELGTLEDEPRAIEYLLEGANDPNPTIRVKAIDTLGNMKAKEAVGPLMQRIHMRQTDEPTKRRILACLGKIGDERATVPLLHIVARPDVPNDLQASAIYALGEIGDDSALPALEALADAPADDPLRPVAKTAVSMIRNRPIPVEVPPVLEPEPQPPGGQAAGN
jgi:HEAT repeat protein